MSQQWGTAGAAGDQRERGRSVTSHSDWNIRDWAHRATGRTPAQSRPQRSGPGRDGEWMAQRAQEQGTQGEKKERVRRDTRRQEECGRGWEDEEEKVQYEASGRLETSTVCGGVDGGEEQRCTTSTTRVGRANSGTEGASRCRAGVEGEATARLRAQAQCHVCTKMSHKPEPKPSQSLAAEVARGVGGAGAGGSESQGGTHAGGLSPAPPLTYVLGGIRGGVVTLVSRESGDGPAGRATNERAAEERRGRGGGRGGRRQWRASRREWREDGGGGSGSRGAGGGAGAASSSQAAGGPVQHSRVDGRLRCWAERVGSGQHPRGVGG